MCLYSAPSVLLRFAMHKLVIIILNLILTSCIHYWAGDTEQIHSFPDIDTLEKSGMALLVTRAHRIEGYEKTYKKRLVLSFIKKHDPQLEKNYILYSMTHGIPDREDGVLYAVTQVYPGTYNLIFREYSSKSYIHLNLWKNSFEVPEHVIKPSTLQASKFIKVQRRQLDIKNGKIVILPISSFNENTTPVPIEPSVSYTEHPEYSFAIKPGEIIYIGDLYVEYSKKTIRQKDMFEQAKQFLKNSYYPELSTKLEKRLLIN